MALVRQNGQLTEVNSQPGQPAGANPLQPVTPAGVAAQPGATPGQAKMAGTPAQKQAALSPQTAPGSTLAQAQRVSQQAAPKATPEQANASSFADRLQSLNGLQGRVQDQVAQNMAGAQAASMGINQDMLKGLGLTPANYTQAASALNVLAKDPTNTAMVNLFQQMTGGQDPTKFMSQDLGAAAAAGVENQVTLGSLKNLGMSEQDMTSILGANWKSMDLGKLDQAVKDLQQKQFSGAQQNAALLSDPNAAGREALAAQARQMSATGEMSRDQAVSHLSNAVTQVSENTKALLSDDNISKSVIDYLANPTASDLKTTHPELAAWADQNKAALAHISDQVSGTNAQVTATAAANKKAFELPAGTTPLSDAAVTAMGGAQGASAANTALISAIKGAPDASAASAAINALADHDTTALDALKKLPADKISALVQSGALANYGAAVQKYNDLKSMPNNINSVLSYVLGEGVTPDQAQQMYAQDKDEAQHGDKDAIARSKQFQQLMDRDNDGKIDAPADIKQRLQQSVGQPDLKSMLAGKPVAAPDLGLNISSAERTATKTAQDLFTATGIQPGQFFESELPAATKTISSVLDQLNKAGYDPAKKYGGTNVPINLSSKDITTLTAEVDKLAKLPDIQQQLEQELDHTADPKGRDKLQSFIDQINQGIAQYNKIKPFVDNEGGTDYLAKNWKGPSASKVRSESTEGKTGGYSQQLADHSLAGAEKISKGWKVNTQGR